MITLVINENIFIVKEGVSILEACKFVGVQIPRFCYHETLSIAGNCRMCLVKLEENDNLIVSCVTEARSEMQILSEDPTIKKAREEILEFLLLDHPLDCPICDQAGECDLQDQTKTFGSNTTKFNFNKIGVEDKNFGIFIKSIMTRCIHCTRCVRFSTEIAGVDFFGTLNRGNFTEIGTYSQNIFDSEVSGNVIDLCPVGALTSKPYAFKYRPWELKSVSSIDLTDGVGSNIYVHFTNSLVSRILPKFNSEINETLITDKARFSFDAFSSCNVLKNISEIKNYAIVNSNEELNFGLENIRANEEFQKYTGLRNFLIVVSEELSYENFSFLQQISRNRLDVHLCTIETASNYNNSNLFANKSNSIANIKNCLNSIFLLGANPRIEAALINVRLRFLSNNDYYKIYTLGFKVDSNLTNSFINFNIKFLISLIEGKSVLSTSISLSHASLFILGNNLKNLGFTLDFVEFQLKKVNPSLIFLKPTIKNNTTSTTFLGIKGLNSNLIKKADFIFFLQVRESAFLKKHFSSSVNKKYFWLNSFYSFSSWSQNLSQLTFFSTGFLIPLKSSLEEFGMYNNFEFRPQRSQKIYDTKTNVKSLNSLLSFFFNRVFKKYKYDFFFTDLIKNPHEFKNYKKHVNFTKNTFFNISKLNSISVYPLKPLLLNFFNTSNRTDFSTNMLTAAREFEKKIINFF